MKQAKPNSPRLRVRDVLFGAALHLALSGVLFAMLVMTGVALLHGLDYFWVGEMAVFFLSLWNLPVWLYDHLISDDPSGEYWFDLLFSKPNPVYIVLFSGWVIACGCLFARWRSRRRTSTNR